MTAALTITIEDHLRSFLRVWFCLCVKFHRDRTTPTVQLIVHSLQSEAQQKRQRYRSTELGHSKKPFKKQRAVADEWQRLMQNNFIIDGCETQ